VQSHRAISPILQLSPDYQVCEVMTTRYGWVDTGECEILRILRTERHRTDKEGVDSTGSLFAYQFLYSI